MGTFTLADGATGAFHSNVLEDYSFAGEIQGESDVSVVQLGPGLGYAPLFIGKSGSPVYVAPDPTAAEGWSQELLPADLSTGQVAGCVDASGTPTVFAIGPDQSSPDLWKSTRGSGGTWAEWVSLPADPGVPAGMTIADLVVDGSTLYVVLEDGAGNSAAWHVGWTAPGGSWTLMGGALPGLVAPATVSLNGGLVRGLVAAQSGDAGDVDVVFLPPAPGAATTLATGITVNLLVSSLTDAGSSLIFFADKGSQTGNPSISVIDGAAPLAGPTTIDAVVTATALAAADAGPAPPTLFVTTATGKLLMWQPAADYGLFDLGLKLSSVATGTGPDGHGELLGINLAKIGLERWWQQPAGPGSADDPGAWTSDDIRLPVTGLASQYAHSTAFTLTDANGAVLALAPVLVYADEVVALTAGDTAGTAGPTQGLATSTDGSGRVRVTVPTDRISTAKLKVVPAPPGAAATSFEDVPWVMPNENILARAKTATVDQVKTLVRDPADAPAVQQAMVAAGQAAYPDNPSPAPAEEQKSWRIRFQTGAPAVFEELSHEEAAALIAATPGQDRELGGWFDWFEDVAEAIVNAAETFYEAVITPIVDGIKVAITAIIDGFTYVFKAVVDAVEEGLEFIQTVLAAAWAALKRLVSFFGWLLTEARADIWRTKQHLEQVFISGMAEATSLAGQGVALSDAFFADAKALVQTNFNQLIAAVGSDTLSSSTALAAAGQLGNPVDDALDWIGSAAMWLWDKLMSLGAGLDAAFSLPADLAKQVTAFLGELGDNVLNSIGDAIDRFASHVAGFASSAASLDELLLKTLLEAAEDIILAVLGIADAASHAFLEVLAAVLGYVTTALQAEISDPILQALYDLANPGASETITALGVGALLLAVPGTVIYYAIKDEAPYPSEEVARRKGGDDVNVPALLGGILTILPWAPADIFADVSPPTAGTSRTVLLLRTIVLGNVVPLAIYFLMWPGAPSFNDPKEKWNWAAILVGGGGLAYNLIVTFLTGGTRGARHPTYVLGMGAFGLCALATNIANRAVNSGNTADWLIAFSGPLPAAIKPLSLTSLPHAKVVLGITDGVCDGVLGGARIAKAV